MANRLLPPARPSTAAAGASSSSSSSANQNRMVGDYRIDKEIGSGSFATVYRGVHVKTKEYVAVKTVSRAKLNKKLLDNLKSEINILKNLHHPHIVGLVNCIEGASYIHIIMEYCSLGDLSGFIRKRDKLYADPTCAGLRLYPYPPAGGLPEVVVRHFMKQLSSALLFLRSKNLIHRDVKPQNLILLPPVAATPPEAATLDHSIDFAGIPSLPMMKLADFGFARSLPSTSLADTLCGSPLYMAPEILSYQKYDAKADLWSVGTVLFEMIVGKPPFKANNHVDLLRRIEAKEDQIRFPQEVVISREMKKLVRALLKRHPTQRMTFDGFFEDEVITGPIPGLAPEHETGVGGSLSSRFEESGTLGAAGRPSSVVTQDFAIRRQPSRTETQRPLAIDTRTEEAINSIPRHNRISPTHRHSNPNYQAAQTAAQRPVPQSHVSAPPRQLNQTQVQSPQVAAAVQMERIPSQQTASPGSSFLVQNQQQKSTRDQRHVKDRERDRAEQEVMFEREYVMVDKRALEVNVLADELANSPRMRRISGNNSPSPPATGNTGTGAGALARRATTAGHSAPKGGTMVSKRPESYFNPRSYERRYGSSPGTGQSALAKALHIANFKLFGMPAGHSPPNQPFPAFPTTGFHQVGAAAMITNSGTSEGNADRTDKDSEAAFEIEEAAMRSDVVFNLAEIKYTQLAPIPPSVPTGLGLLPPTEDEPTPDFVEEAQLTLDAVVVIGEEALVLYVKTLSLLSQTLQLAGKWWTANNHDAAKTPSATLAGERINNAVQWSRKMFNETLEKAEYVKLKLGEAQRDLAASQTGSSSPGRKEPIPTPGDDWPLTTGVKAEKLMYDRALEMSRGAAVNELMAEDLPSCEQSYAIAIRMLEAVLVTDEDGSYGMEEEDRKVVDKFIASIRKRLSSLQRKMHSSRRSSGGVFHSVPSSPHPNSSPKMPANTPPRA